MSDEELELRRSRVHKMGGDAKLQERRGRGLMNARERIAALCDEGSFSEMGEFAHSARPEDKDRTPADGIVTGFGRVDGRAVAVAAFDLTTLGASSSVMNIRKLAFLKDSANRAGIPCVFLIESAGARMPDIQGAVGMGRIGQLSNTGRDRKVPWACAVLGPCYGMGTWYAVQSDFSVMRRDATFSVSSPKVIAVALSETVTATELGGSDVHADVTGLIDEVTDTDAEAIASLRRFLSYLPSNNAEPPPAAAPGDGQPPAVVEALVPSARNRAYDGRKLIEALADAGSVMPFRPRHGRTIETALARIEGQVVGLVASNPMRKGGAIDGASCDKYTEFVVLCDSFNIPLVLLADTPGFLVGMQPEHDGVAGKIINNQRAVTLATVPKIAVVVRKSYGQAYLNLGGGVGADVLAVMTTAEVGFVDPAVAVSVVHDKRPSDAADDYGVLMQQMIASNSPFDLAGMFAAQAVIRPGETREWLARMLDVYRRRASGGIGQHRLATWPTSL